MDEKPAKEKETSGEWSMPEPVFRSSEGVSLKEMMSAAKTEVGFEDEIPTEMMAFAPDEAPTADDKTPKAESDGVEQVEPHKQSVRVKEKSRRRHTKKKRTKSKLMRGLALFVGLLIGSVILAVIYFLFR
ncbi:MAG: hypothetical protein ACKVQW_01500 [Pyrinomonadaceae bacterium]